MPGGVTPESWPVLAAFIVLVSPFVVYIKISHDREVAFLKRLLDQVTTDRDRLVIKLEEGSEKLYRFTDAMTELRDAVKDLTRARQSR